MIAKVADMSVCVYVYVCADQQVSLHECNLRQGPHQSMGVWQGCLDG